MRSQFGVIFWLHCLVIAIGYASWRLFDWRIVIAGMLLYYVQLLVFRDCVLTSAQFGNRRTDGSRTTFYFHYLDALGVPVSNRATIIFADYVLPPTVALSAVWSQLLLGLQPLL
jgi:hypothetical protein